MDPEGDRIACHFDYADYTAVLVLPSAFDPEQDLPSEADASLRSLFACSEVGIDA